jgi:hypothetical protein
MGKEYTKHIIYKRWLKNPLLDPEKVAAEFPDVKLESVYTWLNSWLNKKEFNKELYRRHVAEHRAAQRSDGSYYAEAHHIQPLGQPDNGADIIGNILCVCPNHHAELDLRARRIELADLRTAQGHTIDRRFVDYHNQRFTAHITNTGDAEQVEIADYH